MNKAAKYIQNGAVSSSSTDLVEQSQQNVLNSVMRFLPDNRPITSLQIVEDYEKCPKNFFPIHRSYDQDADADLWRESSILFGKQTTRYLCLSKTEGLPEYVVESLKIIAEKIQPPKGFSQLSRTADTEQRAWRKRQIIYKLSNRESVTQSVTDIILCSKLRIAPDGFKLAGEINGILVCYKTSPISNKIPSSNIFIPQPILKRTDIANNKCGSEVKYSSNIDVKKMPLDDHDYEEIISSNQINVGSLNAPQRPAPLPPKSKPNPTKPITEGTLGAYSELEGVPFMLNSKLMKLELNHLPLLTESPNLSKELEYDFQLERQILCTMKSSNSKNPFFK